MRPVWLRLFAAVWGLLITCAAFALGLFIRSARVEPSNASWRIVSSVAALTSVAPAALAQFASARHRSHRHSVRSSTIRFKAGWGVVIRKESPNPRPNVGRAIARWNFLRRQSRIALQSGVSKS